MTKTEAMYRISSVQVPPPPAPQTAQLTVSSSPSSGFVTTLSQGGVVIDSGLTPKTFVLEVGQAYVLGVQDAGINIFDRWSDGNLGRERIIQPFSTSPLSLTALFTNIVIPPPPPIVPPPPPIVPPPPPTTGGVIATVTCNYWHYINIAGTTPTNNIYAEVGYTASQLLMSARCVMVIKSGGVEVDRWTHDVSYFAPGKSFDNLPMYRNLPTGIQPSSVTLEFFFVDQANPTQQISPTTIVSGVNLNSFNGQYLPLAPVPPQTASVKVIHYAYQPVSSGAFQARAVATYRAAASIIGQNIKGRLELFSALPSSGVLPFVTQTYADPGIPAAAAGGVVVLRVGTIAGGDPDPLYTRTSIVDATDVLISNIDDRIIAKNAEFP